MLSSAPAIAQWGGSLGVASDYVLRGVSHSDGDPSGQIDVHYYGSRDWYAGLWAASVRRGDEHTTAELNAYLGYNFAIAGAWNGSLSLVHYDDPWNHPRRDYNYDELSATIAYSDRVFVSAAASPDTPIDATYADRARRAAFAYDLAAHQPLWRNLAADAGIGYYDLHRQIGAGYVYYSGGLDFRWRALQVQLLYIGTNATAKRLFYEDAAHHWTLTALWRF
jgi:uncharacterized protein (TIGR02001 family)